MIMKINFLFSILTFLSLYLTLNKCIFFISDIFTPSYTLNVYYLTENSLRNQPMSTVIILVISLSVSVFINLILITCGILLCRYFFTFPYSNQNYQKIFKEWVSLIDYLVLNYHQWHIWYMYLCFITKK